MKIKLLRYRNIKLTRREAGEVLTVGEDVTQGQAEALVRVGGAEWIKVEKPVKKNKADSPAKENK